MKTQNLKGAVNPGLIVLISILAIAGCKKNAQTESSKDIRLAGTWSLIDRMQVNNTDGKPANNLNVNAADYSALKFTADGRYEGRNSADKLITGSWDTEDHGLNLQTSTGQSFHLANLSKATDTLVIGQAYAATGGSSSGIVYSSFVKR